MSTCETCGQEICKHGRCECGDDLCADCRKEYEDQKDAEREFIFQRDVAGPLLGFDEDDANG